MSKLMTPSQPLTLTSNLDLQTGRTWTDRETMYISYIGKLFLRMLKALILPLIIPSLVAAVGSLDMSLSGKVRELRKIKERCSGHQGCNSIDI